jgi:hypothetical protein
LKWGLQRLNLRKWFCEGLGEAVGWKQKGQEGQKRQKSFLLFLSSLPFLLPFQFCLRRLQKFLPQIARPRCF